MQQQQPAPGHRRGSVSVFVLIVLLLMTGIVFSRARYTIAFHRQCRSEADHQQTELLADAGLQLARQAWEAAPEAWEYDWNLPPGTVHKTKTGRVQIRTSADGTCSVVAHYPLEMQHPPRVTRMEDFAR